MITGRDADAVSASYAKGRREERRLHEASATVGGGEGKAQGAEEVAPKVERGQATKTYTAKDMRAAYEGGSYFGWMHGYSREETTKHAEAEALRRWPDEELRRVTSRCTECGIDNPTETYHWVDGKVYHPAGTNPERGCGPVEETP